MDTPNLDSEAGYDDDGADRPASPSQIVRAGMSLISGEAGRGNEELEQLEALSSQIRDASEGLPMTESVPIEGLPLDHPPEDEAQRVRALIEAAINPPAREEATKEGPVSEPESAPPPSSEAEAASPPGPPVQSAPSANDQILATVLDLVRQQQQESARVAAEREEARRQAEQDPRRVMEAMQRAGLDPTDARDVAVYRTGVENERLRSELQNFQQEFRLQAARLDFVEKKASAERDLESQLSSYADVPAETRAVLAEQAAALIHAGHPADKAYEAALRAVKPLLDAKFKKSSPVPNKGAKPPSKTGPKHIDTNTRRQLEATSVSGRGSGKRDGALTTQQLLDKALRVAFRQ